MKTGKTTLHLLVWLLLLAGSGGCTRSILQVRPVSGEVAWIDGRPTTRTEQDSLGLVASFERLDMQYLALDIEIKNRSGHAIEVNPTDFRYVALNADRDTVYRVLSAGSSYPLVYSAADPALEGDRVVTNQEREVKRLKRAKVINTVLMVAVIASDVASTASSRNRSPERWVQNRVTHDNLYTAIQAKRLIDHGTFADRMQRYDYESYRWKELALKRTTVEAGQSVRGLVYLPYNREISYLLVGYTRPELQPVTVTFRQEWVKERSRKTASN
ncbi:hypothetical protein [Larkinella soli]|uniref:hypothetical protein n=1 Tax=Larkinella soli TaxID=1770527 RepID=UPI000FFBAEBB|nr:hypothetical protein [Larkinella soli]